MNFQVPQFIEREAKIAGPLTFKQFSFLGAAGVVIFFLYFALGTTNFSQFLLISIVVSGVAAAMAFIQVSGQPLYLFLITALKFTISSRLYLWQKKEEAAPVFIKTVKEKTEEKNEPPKVAGRSQLNKLSTKIETGLKM